MMCCRERRIRIARFVPLAFCVSIISACGEHGTGPSPASVASISISSGDNQVAFAGAPLPAPILIAALDASGNRVPGQTASFSVTSGGGSLSATTAQSGSDGLITVPAWTLGKIAIGQEIKVVIGTAMTTIKATVRSDYRMDLQFFGPVLSQDQQAIVTGAVNRIRAIVVGSVPAVDISGVGAAPCGECRAQRDDHQIARGSRLCGQCLGSRCLHSSIHLDSHRQGARDRPSLSSRPTPS